MTPITNPVVAPIVTAATFVPEFDLEVIPLADSAGEDQRPAERDDADHEQRPAQYGIDQRIELVFTEPVLKPGNKAELQRPRPARTRRRARRRGPC